MREQRLTTEDIPSIVVRDLYERGSPRADSLVRHLSHGARPVVLELTPYEDHVLCSYRLTTSPGPPTEYLVPVSWTPANLGGRRAWFHCPWSTCTRRIARLFFVFPCLVCQRCAGVSYPSQVDAGSRHRKRVARAEQIRLELGGSPSLDLYGVAPLPERPPGMHRKTYRRLCAELRRTERAEAARVDQALQTGETSFVAVFIDALRVWQEARARDEG